MQIVLGGKLVRGEKCFGGLYVSWGILFLGAFVLGGFLTDDLWLGGNCPGAFCDGLLTGYLVADITRRCLFDSQKI